MAVSHFIHPDPAPEPVPHTPRCPCNECQLRRWSELRAALEAQYGPAVKHDIAPEVLKGLVLSFLMLACLWMGACL